MLLAVTKNNARQAHFLCDEAGEAKQYLQRHAITQMSVDYYLNGRENGYQFLSWSIQKGLLPAYVVLTETSQRYRKVMATLLSSQGYRSADGINYMRYH